MGACFDRLTWSYAKAGVTVACEGSHPTSADEDIMVNVCGANKIQDLLAQVTGDFNGSYVAGGSKDASAKVRLTYGQTKQVSPNREFDLPVYVVNPMKVGATSLILNFPANLVEVKNVIMDGGLLDWNMNGNELRIGWHTLNPVSLNAHANLVTLHLKTTGDFKVGTSIRLSLASNDMNELADQFAKPIPDAILSVDVIEASPIGIPENLSASDLTLDNHPNPFSNETMFNYSLPFDGRVTLVIHNLLGETVRTLVNESQTQGDHTIRFDAGSMATGVYTATIKLDANSARLERTIKLIRNK
ncbi:MAG: T9SS type A sorting domain-containing protein [Bacteroidetes bacterium]|nr:T9SS type A sorting domain-containing protein [Bacteroidota bacterium]